jgi:hypothetical protein
MTMAKMKLAIGPAATIATRAPSDFPWKLCLRSSSLSACRGRWPALAAFLVVDEFHVAAERDPGEPPARPVPVVEADDLRPETDRECLDRHAAPAGHKKMAELVEEHHDGEHEQEGKQIREHGVAEA